VTPGDGQDVLARFKDAREQRDPDLMLALFAEDAEYRADPFEAPVCGALALREHWNQVAATQDDVDFDAERVWVAGHAVLASWHAAHTQRATGHRLRERGFYAFELDGAGLVARLRAWTVSRVVDRDGAVSPEGAAATVGEGEDGR
jgi:ketosteroid isomerase-like protein